MRARRVTAALLTAGAAFVLPALVVQAAAPSSFVGPFAVDTGYYSGATPRLHSDPAAAVDPANERRVVVTDVDRAGGACAVALSTDAGRTWVHAPVAMPAGFISCAGPGSGPMAAVFTAGNPVFLAQVSSANGASSELVTMSSSDGGASFAPSGVLAVASAGQLPAQSAQQVSLAADPGVAGGLVAAYGCGGNHSGGAATELCVAVSTDSGRTWASLGTQRCQLCSPASDPDTFVSWPRVTVTGAGTVIVAWRGVNPLIDAPNASSLPVSTSSPSLPEPAPGAASCGSDCRLYTARFPKGATSPATKDMVAAVADDPLGTPALAADPTRDFAYLLWHSTGTDAAGRPIEAIWMVYSQDGGTTWHSRAFRDALIPTILGDATGDAVFPTVAVAPNGRVDVAYVRMARAPQAPNEYCYQYAQSKPAAGATCPTDVTYTYSDDAGASLSTVGMVTPHPYDSLAGVTTAVPHAVGEHGVAVASSNDGGHPVWTTASGSERDVMTDCFTFGAQLCVPPVAAVAPPTTSSGSSGSSSASNLSVPTLTLIYDHRYHLVGDLYTRLPDAPALPPKVILRVVAPEHLPLALPIAVLVVSLLILAAGAVTGGRRARALLQARRAANTTQGQ